RYLQSSRRSALFRSRSAPHPPPPPLFPYTTLFRSGRSGRAQEPNGNRHHREHDDADRHDTEIVLDDGHVTEQIAAPDENRHPRRSEEHTSELQSRENLVCRLLLEKKKIITKQIENE